MNDLSFEILNILYDECPDDSYKIVDVNDLILGLPEGFSADAQKLFEVIEDLATDGSIMLKYRDDEDICLAVAIKGRRIVKKERETRAKIEAQRKAREEEEARLRAIAEEAERLKKEKEEQERLERLEKERKLEEARQALLELQAQKKSKKEVIELKQQVEELEKEVIIPEEEVKEEIKEIVPAEQMPTISAAAPLDLVPVIKKVGKVAFWSGLIGVVIGDAIFYIVKFFWGF